MSGHEKNSIERGALTLWRRHRERHVRTRDEFDRPRHTHFLEMAEGGACQNAGRITQRKAHSQTGDGSGGTCQETETNRLGEAHSLPRDGKAKNWSGDAKNPIQLGILTLWRRQRERVVRKQKEFDRARHAHALEAAGGGGCQNMEGIRPKRAYSQTGNGRRELSGNGHKQTERGPLTTWRQEG